MFILHFIISAALPFIAKCIYHNTWSLEVHPNASPEEIAHELDIQYLGKISSVDNHHLFKYQSHPTYSDTHSHDLRNTLINHRHVRDATQQQILKRVKRSTPEFSFNDVYFPKQWYLYEDYNNVTGAWKQGVSGQGIVVTILDDGIERTHPDLMVNYEPKASTDLNDNDDDPMPRYDITNENKHGTRCAGEVSSAADNEVCGVGAAYHSRIGGIRMLDGDVTDAIEAMAIGYNQDFIDIYSASWGPDDDGRTVDGPGSLTVTAFTKGIQSGRDGRGSIFVWASGNGGISQDNCNCDGYTNSIWTLSIGSTSENGFKPWYAEECSSTLAVTYSSGSGNEKQILSTDLHSKCTERHTGTSAAAPLAAGIFALVLQANPLLTWRDLQHLVVKTAKPRNLQHPEWVNNGAGFNVSHKFGFGVIDAGGLVELATLWNNVPDQEVCESELQSKDKEVGNSKEEEFKISFDGCGGKIIFLEHVQCVVTIHADRRGDIGLELTSPSGTVSSLLTYRKYDRSTKGFNKWPFLNVHNWGENPKGTWILKIKNNGVEKMRIVSWQLVFYGTKSMPQLRDSKRPVPNNGNQEELDCDRHCDLSLGCHGPGPGNCTACTHYLQQSTKMCVDICGPGEHLDRKGAVCIAHCATGEFVHSSGQCKECDSLCDACDGPTAYNCTSCTTGKFLLNSKRVCVDSCPQDTIMHIGKCEPCHADCLTCTNIGYDKCLTCKPSLFFLSNRCYQSCPPGYYGDDKSGTCQACFAGCSSCYGSSKNECISCINELFLAESECLTSCPPSFYTLYGNSTVFKKTTKVGNHNDCRRCHYTCQACSGDTAFQCTKCVDGLFLLNGLCLKQCTAGFIGIISNGLCEICHESCSTCFGTKDYQCNSCKDGLNLVGGKCVAQCLHVSHCISCNSEKLCDLCSKGFVLDDGKCFSQCPNGMFKQNNSCEPCDVAGHCSSCNTKDKCLSCKQDYTLLDGICNSPCPNGQFYSERSCHDCYHKCDTCFGQSDTECTACRDITIQSQLLQYHLKGQVFCDECSSECQLCSQPYNNYCLSCHNGRYLLKDTNNIQRAQCVDSCPRGTYATDENGLSICSLCDETCEYCNGPYSTSCTKCSSGFILQGNSCFTHCSESFYSSENSCLPCDNSCRTCTGSGSSACLSCPPGFFLEQQQCVRDCSLGFFKHGVYCERCHPTCTECSGSHEYQCSQCIDGFTLATDTCVDSCSQGFYNDQQINMCKPCHITCQNCTDEGLTKCLACKPPLVKNIKNNECWQCCSETVKEHCCYCSGSNINYCVDQIQTHQEYSSFNYSKIKIFAGVTFVCLITVVLIGTSIYFFQIWSKKQKLTTYSLLTAEDNEDDYGQINNAYTDHGYDEDIVSLIQS